MDARKELNCVYPPYRAWIRNLLLDYREAVELNRIPEVHKGFTTGKIDLLVAELQREAK